MCELTKEAYEADTHQPLEIGKVPTRRTWYGIVGSDEGHLNPENLTEDHEFAKSLAYVHNRKYPSLGPWHVVVLTENLRTPV